MLFDLLFPRKKVEGVDYKKEMQRIEDEPAPKTIGQMADRLNKHERFCVYDREKSSDLREQNWSATKLIFYMVLFHIALTTGGIVITPIILRLFTPTL